MEGKCNFAPDINTCQYFVPDKEGCNTLKGAVAFSGNSVRRRNRNILGKRNGLRDIISKR